MPSIDASHVNSPAQPAAAADACSGTGREMSAEMLTQIAAGLGDGDVTGLLPAGTERRWALVLESDAYEAWVIAWPAGTGLELHDHGGSAAAVHVVTGRLRERYVDADGGLAVRWLSAGETVSLAGDHQHEVINLTTEDVVSVHVYSPPLADQSFRATRSV